MSSIQDNSVPYKLEGRLPVEAMANSKLIPFRNYAVVIGNYTPVDPFAFGISDFGESKLDYSAAMSMADSMADTQVEAMIAWA